MANDERPDYFAAAPSIEDTVLRGIKGNFRRQMIIKSLLSEGLASVQAPTDTSCQIEFSSFFYPNLDHLATEIGIKSATMDSPGTRG
jgi:hypothetical protein